jgi:hypothetical protein
MHEAGSILYASLVNHTYEFLSVTHHQIALDSSHRLVRGASYERHYGNGCRWRAHLRSTKLEQWKQLPSVKVRAGSAKCQDYVEDNATVLFSSS